MNRSKVFWWKLDVWTIRNRGKSCCCSKSRALANGWLSWWVLFEKNKKNKFLTTKIFKRWLWWRTRTFMCFFCIKTRTKTSFPIVWRNFSVADIGFFTSRSSNAWSKRRLWKNTAIVENIIYRKKIINVNEILPSTGKGNVDDSKHKMNPREQQLIMSFNLLIYILLLGKKNVESTCKNWCFSKKRTLRSSWLIKWSPSWYQ